MIASYCQPGRSENMVIHSLKSEVEKSSVLKCANILSPANNGKEGFPSNNVSHK